MPGIKILLHKISTGAAHDSAERYPPPKCDLRTQGAVLSRIDDWISRSDQDGARRVLWIYGRAGTAIAQTAAERCAERNELAASYFFTHPDPSLVPPSSRTLWTTIAFQIAMSVPPLRSAIARAVLDNPDIFEKSPSAMMQKLIVEPFRAQGGQSAEGLPLLVIIDGLDKCSEPEGNDILRSVANAINTHHLPLRFLVTTCLKSPIHRSFDSPGFRHILVRISVDEPLRNFCKDFGLWVAQVPSKRLVIGLCLCFVLKYVCDKLLSWIAANRFVLIWLCVWSAVLFLNFGIYPFNERI